MAKIEWQRAEWSDDDRALDVFIGGWMVSVAPDDEEGDWVWMVRATSQVSEVPEVWDSGVTASESSAKGAAVKAAREAVKKWRGKGVKA